MAWVAGTDPGHDQDSYEAEQHHRAPCPPQAQHQPFASGSFAGLCVALLASWGGAPLGCAGLPAAPFGGAHGWSLRRRHEGRCGNHRAAGTLPCIRRPELDAVEGRAVARQGVQVTTVSPAFGSEAMATKWSETPARQTASRITNACSAASRSAVVAVWAATTTWPMTAPSQRGQHRAK